MDDDSLKRFTNYFRDIYTASSSNCPGLCDQLVAPTVGATGYDLRRCCKSACSTNEANSRETCENDFCPKICMQEMADKSAVDECVHVCATACRQRWKIRSALEIG